MSLRVGVIGAGISGLTLALKLAEDGHPAVVFDKGRGVGGRASTCRGDRASFDHGAQYFTVRDPKFRAFLDRHVPADRLAAWAGRFASLEGGRLVPESRQEARFVGVPGMSAIARALATTLDVRAGVKVAGLAGSPGRWDLVDDVGDSHGPFDWVVSTAPPAQSSALLGDRTPIGATAGGVAMRPCFALMLAPEDGASLPADGIRCDHPVLGWAANDHSKPGRGPGPALVIQSGHDWAEAHREDDHASVALALREAAASAFGVDLGAVGPESVHRWLHAKPVRPLGRPCLIDAPARLAACGDWCVAAKVEGAFLSGEACARAILEASG